MSFKQVQVCNLFCLPAVWGNKAQKVWEETCRLSCAVRGWKKWSHASASDVSFHWLNKYKMFSNFQTHIHMDRHICAGLHWHAHTHTRRRCIKRRDPSGCSCESRTQRTLISLSQCVSPWPGEKWHLIYLKINLYVNQVRNWRDVVVVEVEGGNGGGARNNNDVFGVRASAPPPPHSPPPPSLDPAETLMELI